MIKETSKEPIDLYEFKGINYSEIYDEYYKKVNPQEVNIPSTIGEMTEKTNGLKRAVKGEDAMYNQIRYIQNFLITEGLKNENHTFNIHSRVLGNCIGGGYRALLEVFREKGYIRYGDEKTTERQWREGRYATKYTLLNLNIRKYRVINRRISQMIETANKKAAEIINNATYGRMIQKFSKDFTQNYLKSLNAFKVDNIGKFKKDLEKAYGDKKENINFLLDEANSKERTIRRIDVNNRIYHFLSSMKSELRTHFNISYKMDIHNSHPLLLLTEVFDDLGTNLENRYEICRVLSDKSYDEDLREYVKDIVGNKDMTDSTLRYICLVCSGKFWEYVKDRYKLGCGDNDCTKAEFFKSVLYSKDPFSIKYNELLKSFVDEFEQIGKIIMEHKHSNTKANGGRVCTNYLPNDLMKIESKIFINILKSVYQRGYLAIHIHDCIVIPRNYKRIPKDVLISIIEEEYKKFGLYPSLGE